LLDKSGFALSMQATAMLSLNIPGVEGIRAFADFSLDLNRTGKVLDQSIAVGGEQIHLQFGTADNATRFHIGKLDATIGSTLGGMLADMAHNMSDSALELRKADKLPVVGKSVDELFDLSPVLGVGDYMLHYLAPVLPDGDISRLTDAVAVDYGRLGEPTFLGMLDYLNNQWLRETLDAGSRGLSVVLNDKGFALSFEGAFSRNPSFDLDLATSLGDLGIDVTGKAAVSGHLRAALDFDFKLGWESGLQAAFDLHELSFEGSLAANSLVLGAGLGPINLSIGREGRNANGVNWKQGSAAINLSGGIKIANGQFELLNPQANLDLNLPLYASVAGIDLVDDPALTPGVTLKGNVLGSSGLQVATQNFEQFSRLGKLSLVDVLAALPAMLDYLETVDPSSLGLGDLPFIEQGLGDVLDLASSFKTQVVDKIDFYRAPVAWASADRSETQLANGSAQLSASGNELVGLKSQFAASMSGLYVTLGQQTRQIASVSDDGTTLRFEKAFEGLGAQSQTYLVHKAIEKIKTLDEFVARECQGQLRRCDQRVARARSLRAYL
jgi:hypothetical protein